MEPAVEQFWYYASMVFHMLTTIAGLALLLRLVTRASEIAASLRKLEDGQVQVIEATNNVARRK